MLGVSNLKSNVKTTITDFGDIVLNKQIIAQFTKLVPKKIISVQYIDDNIHIYKEVPSNFTKKIKNDSLVVVFNMLSCYFIYYELNETFIKIFNFKKVEIIKKVIDILEKKLIFQKIDEKNLKKYKNYVLITNIKINLKDIYEKIVLCDNIVAKEYGLKWCCDTKYLTTLNNIKIRNNRFRNLIIIVVMINGKKINCKCYNNSKIHITGSKYISDSKLARDLIHDILSKSYLVKNKIHNCIKNNTPLVKHDIFTFMNNYGFQIDSKYNINNRRLSEKLIEYDDIISVEYNREKFAGITAKKYIGDNDELTYIIFNTGKITISYKYNNMDIIKEAKNFILKILNDNKSELIFIKEKVIKKKFRYVDMRFDEEVWYDGKFIKCCFFTKV